MNNVEKMNTYIEGMKECGITMEVTGVDDSQLVIQYVKGPQGNGVFYMGDKPTMESSVRRALLKHYTADRRRMRDWIEDVALMANQLAKRKVEA